MGDVRSAARRARGVLADRRTASALLVAVGGSVALGVVPNILQSWTSAVWLLYVAFIAGVGLVVLGWLAGRDRGSALIVVLQPRTNRFSVSMLRALQVDAARRHGAVFQVDRGELWPEDLRSSLDARQIQVAHQMIKSWLVSGARGGGVSLYFMGAHANAVALGAMLRDERYTMTVMHYQPSSGPDAAGSGLIREVLRLGDHLLDQSVETGDGPVGLSVRFERFGHAQGRQGLPLAVVINVTLHNVSAVADAVWVARSGETSRPDGGDTGYRASANESLRCGAALVVTADALLSPERQTFEYVVRRVHALVREHQEIWSREGGRPDRPLLFLASPAAIGLGLGWAFRHEVRLVPHDMAAMMRGGGR